MSAKLLWTSAPRQVDSASLPEKASQPAKNALLQVLVSLLESVVLIEQALPVDGPLQLRILQLVGLLLLGGQLAPHQRQFLFLLFQLDADILLQCLQVRNELLVLLKDVGEGFRLAGFRAHQAAFRPCFK